jgi:aspartate aminotransferase-like enzyme
VGSGRVKRQNGSGAVSRERHERVWLPPVAPARRRPWSPMLTRMPQNLRTPGPTPLPPEVRAALARDMVDHRGPELAAALAECIAGLKTVFATSSDLLLLTASGTGGLESVVVNTLTPGQRVLVVTIGYFGDRFAEIARVYGADVQTLAVDWGHAADPAVVAERLATDPSIDTLFVTHNETSTGVLNPLADIARAARTIRPDIVIAVDGISSVGSVAIETDAWRCDVVVAGSQKGWMIPPGLAFVSVSERAWARVAATRRPRYYFDWPAYKDALVRGSTPATPAVGLVFALQAGLRLLQAEGLEAVFARHARVAERTRKSLVRLGFALFADPAHASPTVTTALLPDGVDVRLLLRRLREEHDVVLTGGQGAYEGKLLRIGHLGAVTEADIAAVMDALEAELPNST